MKKKRNTEKKVRCIVYISTVGDMQHVNQREQRQMRYISEYANGNNIEVVKVMRRNVLGQLDVPLDINAIRETLSEMLSFKSAYVDHEIIERFVSRIKVIGYDKYKWIIKISGKEFDEAKDMDSEIQITRVLSFEEARAWRKLSGDYVRNRQWNDIEVDVRII